MENEEQNMTHEQVIQKAHDIISHMEEIKTKGNALLLAYDSDKEQFQMLAINADFEEISALVLSCVAAMKIQIKDMSPDRTVN